MNYILIPDNNLALYNKVYTVNKTKNNKITKTDTVNNMTNSYRDLSFKMNPVAEVKKCFSRGKIDSDLFARVLEKAGINEKEKSGKIILNNIELNIKNLKTHYLLELTELRDTSKKIYHSMDELCANILYQRDGKILIGTKYSIKIETDLLGRKKVTEANNYSIFGSAGKIRSTDNIPTKWSKKEASKKLTRIFEDILKN